MKDFYITIKNGLLDPKHFAAMHGETMGVIWLFLWLIDRMTIIDEEKGEGKVLGGRPVKFEELQKEISISRTTYVEWIKLLREGGYIRTKRTPYGLIFTVYKASKIFGQKVDKNRSVVKDRTQKEEKDRSTSSRSSVYAEGRSSNKNTSSNNNKLPKGSNEVALLRTYFIDIVKAQKDFEPEMSFGKEGKLLKDKLARYSVVQLKDLMDKFLKSSTGEDLGYTLSICLSAGVMNKWLAGKLEKPKQPTYNGSPMRKFFGKWQVFSNGDWLDFADQESKIVYT